MEIEQNCSIAETAKTQDSQISEQTLNYIVDAVAQALHAKNEKFEQRPLPQRDETLFQTINQTERICQETEEFYQNFDNEEELNALKTTPKSVNKGSLLGKFLV